MNTIDIANRIIARRSLRFPNSYRDAFQVLYKNKLIDKKLSLQLQDLASFRNILVHEYAEIIPEKVYKKLRPTIQFLGCRSATSLG